MTGTIRCFCPLDCGWHYDRPEPDPTELVNARPDLTSLEVAQIIVGGQLQYDEKVIREHLETHELIEWVQAVSRLTAAVQRVRDTCDRWDGFSPTTRRHSIIMRGALDGHARRSEMPQPATVVNHAYEGTPGPGNACQAEAFGETCNAPWEQHEMRPGS